MLKLKLQYFGHLIQRADSLEKTLMLGKTEGRRRRGTEDEMVGLYHQIRVMVLFIYSPVKHFNLCTLILVIKPFGMLKR